MDSCFGLSANGLSWGNFVRDCIDDGKLGQIPHPNATKIRYTVNTYFLDEPSTGFKFWLSGNWGKANEELASVGAEDRWVYFETDIKKNSTYFDLMIATERMMGDYLDWQHSYVSTGSFSSQEEGVIDVHISS